jgi:hypothetical protein
MFIDTGMQRCKMPDGKAVIEKEGRKRKRKRKKEEVRE